MKSARFYFLEHTPIYFRANAFGNYKRKVEEEGENVRGGWENGVGFNFWE